MSEPESPIIVALDLPRRKALDLASQLRGRVRWVKVGMTLFYAEGPEVVAELKAMGFDVFLDLKLHDIPHQVEGAAAQIARLGVGMFTVHASGGRSMIAAAVASSRRVAADLGLAPPAVLAVTVLTSSDDAALADIGVESTAAVQVARLATLSQGAGVDGLVCAPAEAARVRRLLGDTALVVTPGVRPAGAPAGDQARVATPREALQAGASHLVVGRPITAAADPLAALDDIVAQIKGV